LEAENRQQIVGRESKRRKFRVKIITRGAVIRLGILAAAFVLFCLWARVMMIKMPGKSYAGPLPALTKEQTVLRDELKRDVEILAGEIGERNTWRYDKLSAGADFIESSLEDAGFSPTRQDYLVENKLCSNLEVRIFGGEKPDEIVVVGAHYDTVYGSPGANDNGSAVAAVLALARRFAGTKPQRTLRFVFFTNEEMPFFKTEQMGSLVYAKSCREKGDDIVAMLSIETIGYYSDEPNSQKYPFPFGMVYPSTGNFLGFVGNLSCRDLLCRAISSFRKNCRFPSEGGAIPSFIPGIDWSDHWSFWQAGYPAIMVTDTAPFRYPHYHSPTDTPDKIDFDRLARVVSGLEDVVTDMVSE